MKKFNIAGTTYFIHGEKPSFLVLSGMHGDESEIIPFVRESLDFYKESLPAFLYISEVSPSAVVLKTRVNKSGKDLNREFFDNSKDNEVNATKQIVKDLTFDLCVSFHEDPEQTDFYLYESGDLRGTKIWEKFKEKISNEGVGLMNGIDDTNDVSLGYEFTGGYHSFPPEQNGKYVEDGTFWSWAMNNKIVKRFLNPEIPGKVSLHKKREVVEIFFSQIVIPLLRA